MAKLVALAGATAMITACGASGGSGGGGGGGAVAIGGAIDTPCTPEYHNEGCSPDKKMRVKCNPDATDQTKGQWAKVADCVDQQEYCEATKKDPADTAGIKVLSECKQIQSTSSSGGTSSGGTSSGGTSSGGTSSGGTSSGGTSSGGTSSGGTSSGGTSSGGTSSGGTSGGGTPDAILKCTQEKCAAEWAACMADSMCKFVIECGVKCKPDDEKCISACGSDANENTLKLAVAIQGCAIQNKCMSTGPTGPVCGNEKCEEGENSDNCAKDCPKSGPVCGDGKCEGPENSETCSKDCGQTTPVCGDGKCEASEKDTCAKDCGGTTTGKCGDLVCKAPETQTTCLLDCNPQAKAIGECGMTKCSSQWAACGAATGCLDALSCIIGCQDENCAKACAAKAGSATAQLQSLAGCLQSSCAGGSGGCKSDSDCASGQKCVDGACSGGGTTNPNSCKDRCGKYDQTAKCQCDDQCSDPQYNDCCADIKQMCPATP